MNTATSVGRTVTKPSNFFARLLWYFFGNADDGVDGGPTFMPTSPYWWRCVCWWFRNPMHNWCFYGIGVAEDNCTSWGKDPSTSFVTVGWNYAFTKPNTSKWLYLPFFSYQGGPIRLYWGWRPPEGSFGLKLQRND